MAEKNRNFRSAYYDKVGFRGAEEKKELQILINEKPMQKYKLSKFCLRFSLPPMYREYVWKVLLGVLPINCEYHEKIMHQRNLHYEDLFNALKVMRKIDDSTSKSVLHTLMYLMTFDILQFDMEDQMSSSSVRNLIALATFFNELSSSEVVIFWLFRNFMLHRKKLNYNSDSMIERMEIILKKEDEAIYEHMKNLNVFENHRLIFISWFDKCFAKVLHQNSIERICDKIIGGSCKILPYVGVAMLIIRKNVLLSMKKSYEWMEVLEKNSEETSDLIVTKAMDMLMKVNDS